MKITELLPFINATSTGPLVPQPLPGYSEGWPGRRQKSSLSPFLCTHLLCKPKAGFSFPCSIAFDEEVLQLSVSSAVLPSFLYVAFCEVHYLAQTLPHLIWPSIEVNPF